MVEWGNARTIKLGADLAFAQKLIRAERSGELGPPGLHQDVAMVLVALGEANVEVFEEVVHGVDLRASRYVNDRD
jgi:hypothetical protein